MDNSFVSIRVIRGKSIGANLCNLWQCISVHSFDSWQTNLRICGKCIRVYSCNSWKINLWQCIRVYSFDSWQINLC